MKNKYSKKANDNFIELFSSANNKNVVDAQLKLFQKLIEDYKISPSDAVELLTHISNELDAKVKYSAILSYLFKKAKHCLSN